MSKLIINNIEVPSISIVEDILHSRLVASNPLEEGSIDLSLLQNPLESLKIIDDEGKEEGLFGKYNWIESIKVIRRKGTLPSYVITINNRRPTPPDINEILKDGE